jgi:ankyrin repeat protein
MLLDMGYNVVAQSELSYQAWLPWMLCKMAQTAYAVKGDQANSFIQHFTSLKGRNALMQASYYGNAIAVKKLLSVRADTTKQNHYGHSALHCAATKGHLVVVKLLLAAGAPVSEPDTKGLTASALARRGGHIQVEHALIDAGVASPISGRPNSLCCARRNKKLSVNSDEVFQFSF